MKTAYKVILVNVGTIAACAIVALTLPPDTPAIPFGIVCLGTLIVMNVAVVVWPRYRARSGAGKPNPSSTLKLILVWVLFVLGLILNWMRWHHP